jgi:GT2 family glycosyltransferase
MASVVVPTYQRRDSVRRLLDCLRAQTVPSASFEAIIAIDGSSDGTEEMVRAYDAPFTLSTRTQANAGRAAACNLGIGAARADIVVLVDDDMAPAPHWLEAHLDAHAAHGRRGVMGPVPWQPSADAPPATRYLGEKFNAHLAKLARLGRPYELRDFYSGNFSVPRAVLLEIGGYDESFSEYGNEDLDLCLRLSRIGVEVVFEPRAVAVQHVTKTLRDIARDQRAKGRTAVLLARKHPEAFPKLRLATLDRAPFHIRLARNAILGITRSWPAVDRALFALAERVERTRLPGAARMTHHLAGYYYWHGARDAARDSGATPARTPHAPEERSRT